jgi:hypothetical protein
MRLIIESSVPTTLEARPKIEQWQFFSIYNSTSLGELRKPSSALCPAEHILLFTSSTTARTALKSEKPYMHHTLE